MNGFELGRDGTGQDGGWGNAPAHGGNIYGKLGGYHTCQYKVPPCLLLDGPMTWNADTWIGKDAMLYSTIRELATVVSFILDSTRLGMQNPNFRRDEQERTCSGVGKHCSSMMEVGEVKFTVFHCLRILTLHVAEDDTETTETRKYTTRNKRHKKRQERLQGR